MNESRKENMKNFILTGFFSLILMGIVSAHLGESHGEIMHGAYGGTGMLFGWIFYLIVIALIIAAIYWLIKSANSRDRRR